MPEITIFKAGEILTMDPNRPTATHVAVRSGRILSVGSLDEVSAWGEARIDDRYADKVILPGLVEAHAHVSAGGVWRFVYCGHFSRTDPQGRSWPGVATADALVERLQEADRNLSDPEAPLVAWGFDPNFVEGRRLDRKHLDLVSGTRPVAVLHSNFHLLTANSAALSVAGFDAGTNVEGVLKTPDGELHGELQEFAAMGPVMSRLGMDHDGLRQDPDCVRAYGETARRVGVTTAADLLSDLEEAEVQMLLQVTGEPGFPIRYSPKMNAMRGDGAMEAARANALRPRSTDKLRLGAAKLFTDGSIQGWTAKLNSPGYLTGEDHGIWNMDMDQFRNTMIELHRAGVQTHIHANGDGASEATLDAIEAACLTAPDADHRHVIEHGQLMGRDQFLRARALGCCVNLFANHIHYFGDVHYTMTLGPDRAERMNACRDALDIGVPLAIHSDAPVTPMAPLVTAWAAVTRQTEQGRILGERQKISVTEALGAITLGAAYVLKMDGEIGSIQAGKRADFCVLDDNPLSRPPEELREIGVHATVLDGAPAAP